MADEVGSRTETAAATPQSPALSLGAGRFTPGAVIGGRYRIVAPLGRGGMGEVYRADDTKLGQPVALKFLPQSVAADPDRLQRLFSEVRIGRLVSHPNVCRLYDVEEAEGHHFVSPRDLSTRGRSGSARCESFVVVNPTGSPAVAGGDD